LKLEFSASAQKGKRLQKSCKEKETSAAAACCSHFARCSVIAGSFKFPLTRLLYKIQEIEGVHQSQK